MSYKAISSKAYVSLYDKEQAKKRGIFFLMALGLVLFIIDSIFF